MCDVAIVNGTVCETVGELSAAIGLPAMPLNRLYDPSTKLEAKDCLCGVDIYESARLAGYDCLKKDDIYVLTKQESPCQPRA